MSNNYECISCQVLLSSNNDEMY